MVAALVRSFLLQIQNVLIDHQKCQTIEGFSAVEEIRVISREERELILRVFDVKNNRGGVSAADRENRTAVDVFENPGLFLLIKEQRACCSVRIVFALQLQFDILAVVSENTDGDRNQKRLGRGSSGEGAVALM